MRRQKKKKIVSYKQCIDNKEIKKKKKVLDATIQRNFEVFIKSDLHH